MKQIFFVFFMFFIATSCSSHSLELDQVRLPEGFSIDVFAEPVPGARSLALGSNGTVFVGSRDEGKVYALLNRKKGKNADTVLTIATDLNMPNGVAFHNGALYVAEIGRILRYDDIESHLNNPPKPVVVSDSFPKDEHHGWKFIRFGPDGYLYVPVGAPCNICERKDPRYASIMRLKADGSSLEIFAHGIRNSVGFDWDPRTKELWFTDNGRDWLGDDLPPDELNHAATKGLFFGFPYCYGDNTPDPVFADAGKCRDAVLPAQKLGAHIAPLGIRFYTGTMFPLQYRNQIFIAEHGSWNRSIPNGYRITLVRLENNKAKSYEVFAEGWLNRKRRVWGRPVDLLVMPDGALLVSDDKAGLVYRISYNK
jgi:glucose/arabinose dehydrogenase